MTRPSDAEHIHLDTSYLIRALVPGSVEALQMREWIRSGLTLTASTIVWGEFLCGPVGEEEKVLAGRILRRLVPLDVDEAATAARLFNRTGRRRGSFQDCLVAATALEAAARLATAERVGFSRFRSEGLRLLESPLLTGED